MDRTNRQTARRADRRPHRMTIRFRDRHTHRGRLNMAVGAATAILVAFPRLAGTCRPDAETASGTRAEIEGAGARRRGSP